MNKYKSTLKFINSSREIKNMKYIAGFLLLFLFIGITSAIGDTAVHEYGKVAKGECILLRQTCASCSFVNVSVVYKNETLLSEQSMNRIGALWTYSFCDTEELGRYDVSGHGDLEGTDTGFSVLWFNVTMTGLDGITFLIILITVLALFFLLLTVFVDEEFFVYISGVFFIIGGIFIMINGLDVLNNVNTRYIAFIYIGIGFLLTLGAYIFNSYTKYLEDDD